MLKWLQANALGTYLFTRRNGELVGEDAVGNHYYREERPGLAHRAALGGLRGRHRVSTAAWSRRVGMAGSSHCGEKAAKRGSATDQALGKGASAQSERLARRLRAARARAARRSARRATGDYEAWRP